MLGAFAKLEGVARVIQHGLKVLSLVLLGLGLPSTLLLFFSPPTRRLIPDPHSLQAPR